MASRLSSLARLARSALPAVAPFSASARSSRFFFVLSFENYRIVLSARELSLREAIRINDTEFITVDFGEAEVRSHAGADSGFYRICFQKDTRRLKPVAFNDIPMPNMG